MTVRRGLVVGHVAMLALLAGCSAILGIHDPEIVGAAEAGITDDATTPPSSTDAGIDSAVAPGAMVTVPRPDAGGTFQIDATEVTQAAYGDFLARGTSSVLQLPACAGNTSFRPAGGFAPSLVPEQPVVGVDWCDAYAYCQWVGKRLCGGANGVPGAYADHTVVTKNEWLAACTKDDAQPYPYGALERPAACNTSASDAGATLDVGTKRFCEGGFTGVFDLVGNVAEWVDLCDDTGCATMGGSFSYPPDAIVDCRTSSSTPRLTAFADIGFRCCR